jgi:GxxExxY protein
VLFESTTGAVLGAAMRVHRALGPGLLESAYERCLCVELRRRGLTFHRQVKLPIEYEGLTIHSGYRIDFVIDDCVVLELKAIERLQPIHEAQLLTYLRLSKKRVGLLINFNVRALKHGVIRRVV